MPVSNALIGKNVKRPHATKQVTIRKKISKKLKVFGRVFFIDLQNCG